MRVMQQSNETGDMKANGMTVDKVKGRKIQSLSTPDMQ